MDDQLDSAEMVQRERKQELLMKLSEPGWIPVGQPGLAYLSDESTEELANVVDGDPDREEEASQPASQPGRRRVRPLPKVAEGGAYQPWKSTN